MTNPVLATKLYPPPPRLNGVERARLLLRLEEGFQTGRRLTLVSAPAGFGKTTLISSWVKANNSKKAAWISLDSGENDPVQFLNYLIAGLQQFDPAIGQTILPALKSQPLPPLVALAESLINDITLSAAPFVLVLDDYQLIKSIDVHQLVQLLLERGPVNLHLVIVTREDPMLPLPRLRARGQVTEIRERDLRFNQFEAEAFFSHTMGLVIKPEEIAVLEARTEGWIAGLQLAAIALQENADNQSVRAFVSAFAGSDRFIVDYLASEVLLRLPEPVTEFLMYTSILNRLCGPLCDAVVYGDGVTGKSQEMLDGLERANMFIVPLDNRREWYRYHHLFGDLMRHTLKSQANGRLAELHRRASRWFEARGFLHEAVSHALETQDWDFAAGFIERHAMDMIARSQVATLHEWCAAFPEEQIRARPGICIYLAWTVMLTFRTDLRQEVIDRLAQAEAALDRPGLPSLANIGTGGAQVCLRDWIMGQVFAIRSNLLLAAFNDPVDPQALIELSLKSLELLPETEKQVRVISTINLAHAYMMMGDVRQTEKALAEAARLGWEAGNYFTVVTAMFYQARLAFHLGDVHRAMEICEAGLAELKPLFEHPDQEFPAIRSLYVAQAVIYLEWNDLEQAERLLTVSTNLVGWATWVELIAYAYLVRLWEIRENEEKVLETLSRMEKLGPQQAYCAEALRTRYQVWHHPSDARIWAVAVDWARSHVYELKINRAVFGFGPFQVDAEYIAYLAWLQVEIAIGQPRDALDFLSLVLASAQEKGLIYRTIELSILQALALSAAGETAPALEALKLAVSLAQPGRYHNIFRRGPALYRLLVELPVNNVTGAYVRYLLDSFEPSQAVVAKETSPSQPQSLAEPLSERELEILGLLCKGLSVPEIARQLYISVNTLKAHSQNIYSKLGVHSRVEAINQAHELGLV